jgi:autotransporter-associated beta strand protein
MTCALGNRLVVISVAVAGLGLSLCTMPAAYAATFTWVGSSGATWDTSSTNWANATGGTLWDATTGPTSQASFTTAAASANATGNNLYISAISFGTSASGCTITGGTLNTTTKSSTASIVNMTPTSGTDTISSAFVLGNTAAETFQTAAGSGSNAGGTLNLTGVLTSSGTVIVNPGGGASGATNVSTIVLGGSADSFNWLQQGSGGHANIAIPSGGSVSANLFFHAFYGNDLVNGNLSVGTASINNGTGGPVNFAGSGTIVINNWISNHGGTVTLGPTTGNFIGNFTGSLNVSGSFVQGLIAAGPGNSNGAGSIINQNSGTVVLSGTGDLLTMGYMAAGNNTASSYNVKGGILSIPNTAFDLGFGATASALSTFTVSGGSANVYGLSMGTTQGLGAQNGNCAISVTGGTLNLGPGGIQVGGTGTKSVTLGGNGTIISTVPLSTSLPITLANGGNITLNTSGGNITLAGVLSGSGGLTATGGGTLLMNAQNSYSGATTVSMGTLQLGDGIASVGSLTSNISAASGAVVLYAVPNSSTATYGNAMSGSGSLVLDGPGTLQITGSNSSFTGGTTVSAGTLQFGDGVSNDGSLPSTITNNAAIVFANPKPQTFAASISGSGPVFVNSPAPLTLAGNNTFSGGVTLGPNGYLNVGTNTAAMGTGTLTISGGTVDGAVAGATMGNVPQTWNADFTFGGTNNLNMGTGAVLLGSSRIITLNSGTLTVNGAISDSGAGYSLSNAGTGTLVLGGTSTYSGGTNVNTGNVIVNGALSGSGAVNVNFGALVVNGAITGSGGVIVQSGGTLAGTGLVAGGGVTLSGGGLLSPGPSPLPSSIGTFTASSLSIGSGATVGFDLSTSNTGAGNDLVNVTGNLSLPSNATIAVNPTGGSLSQAGAYTLFNYGSLTNSASGLVYSGPLGARQSANFNYGTGSNSSITLTISGFFANLIWTGTGANTDTWDQNNTGNLSWSSVQHLTGDYFASLDNVTFNATSSPGNQTVTLAGALTPTSVTVTGSKNYTFTGGGQIGGATPFTVVGPGSLNIQNPGNSYTLGTNIQGGAIILGVTNGLPPSGTVTFGAATSNGTLDLAGNSQTVAGLAIAPGATASHQIITGSTGSSVLTFAGSGSSTFGGTITDAAPTGVLALNVASGQLILSGTNTFAGGASVSGGTLQLAVSNALPTNGGITAQPGGVLELGGNGQTTSGTVSFQGGTVQNGTITSTAAAFDAQGGIVSASLAGPVALNKTTAGELFLSGSNNRYSGGTNVSGGTLQLGAPLPAGGNITVFPFATLDLGGVSQSTSGVVSIQGGAIQNGTVNSTAAAFDGQSGTVTANLTGGVGLNKSTSGTLTLGGSNTYTGNTVVNNGTLQLSGAAGIPGGPTAGTLVLNGGASTAGTVDINGIPADVGGLSGAAGTVPGMIVNNNALSSSASLTVGDNNSTTTFSGTIADGIAMLALAKTGAGKLTLDGSNAYSGGTTVSQGILALTNTAALGTVTATTNLTIDSGGELQLPAGVVTNVGEVSVGGNGVTALGAINGGTLNVLGANVTMNASSGTAVISSPTVLNAGNTVLTCSGGNMALLFGGPLSSPGSITTSGSGNFVFGGGAMSITGTLTEGNGTIPSRLAVISVLPGTTFNCGMYLAGFFSTLTVGGTMNAGVFYTDNSTSGNQFVNGHGVINATTFIGSGGGTVEFSNGVLNVTNSASIGPFGPIGTQRLGCTFQQDSGTVNMTGTGDGFTIGSSAASGVGAYTQFGGVLNVPNQYVELCYSNPSGGTNSATYFQVLGSPTSPATANLYGISFGQTVNNPVQNGYGTVKLGDSGSLLVIGSGGIVAASSGSLQVLLASGTLASSAPWTTTVPLTFSSSALTNIDASNGTITLAGPLNGTGGFREIGSGTLVLSGTGTYSGGTTVKSGTLIATSSEALPDDGNLSVGSGIGAFGAAIVPWPPVSAAAAASPVPEPGTPALLAAGGAAVLLIARRRIESSRSACAAR